MALRMSANSAASALPSQVMQPPCGRKNKFKWGGAQSGAALTSPAIGTQRLAFIKFPHSGAQSGAVLKFTLYPRNFYKKPATHPRKIPILTSIPQLQLLLLVFGQTGQKTVKNMVIPLVRILRDDPTFLQQILFYLRPLDDPRTVEMYIDVLPESGTVIVAYGLRITECLQNRIGFEDLLFDPRVFPTYRRQILQYQFRTFRFTRSGFPRNHYTLILAVSSHVSVAIVADGEYVRGEFADLAFFVQFDLFGGVDR